MNPNVNLGAVTKTTNQDTTITLQTSVPAITSFLNSKPIYEFKEAFPNLQNPILQNVYYVSTDLSVTTADFTARTEIDSVEFLDQEVLVFDPLLPNDYNEINLDGRKNTALELIKAPLAWTVTKGSPSILVAVIDSKFDTNHPDLQNKIAINVDDPNSNSIYSHGTGVANLVAGDTDNGVGIASIGYRTKLITADRFGTQRAIEIAQMPGVKVVNCSFVGLSYSQFQDAAITEISETLGVLFVGSSGNNRDGWPENTYRYPASYDSVLSVTSVGNRYDIGSNEASDDGFWMRSWKDVHEFRPDNPEVFRSHTHNDKVNVSAPGHWIQMASDDYFNPGTQAGYFLGLGTSGTAPLASGLAALIYSINPNFTSQEVKSIIENTADDIYYIPENQPYIGQLGSGRINAFRAVKIADCMINGLAGLDLAMQNSCVDNFEEPDVESEFFWESEDIWVRNQNDGMLISEHQNPEYIQGGNNYVYVRVTNNSCETSSGSDPLKLYWAKANGALPWPSHWEDFSVIDSTGQSVLMGDEIGTLQVPVLEPGQSKIIEFEWEVPNPDDYENINDNPWHFCLLARIDTHNDPMTFTEGIPIQPNVKNNNNIVWKNITVIDIIPGIVGDVGGVVAFGNTTNALKAYTLELHPEKNENGKALFEEAEISLEMDTVIYNAWVAGNEQSINFRDTKSAQLKIVNDSIAVLENIKLPANTIGTVNINFNFLTKEQTDKRNFTYRLIQKDAENGEIIGGETFEIRRKPRQVFAANAGGNEEIEKNESVTITAAQINEAAKYNWYDPEGNLVYTGRGLTVSPDVTKTYTLEIISDSDGYKDYDEVEVKVNPYKIESLAPNPTATTVSVNYIADGATSAYLMIVSTENGTSNNYILDPQQTYINLDLSNYENGIYAIALVCDSAIVASKNLYKN